MSYRSLIYRIFALSLIGVSPSAFATDALTKEISKYLSPATECTNRFIANGIETDKYKAVVKLTLSGFLCTGTIIRPNVILTGAHCVCGPFKPRLKINDTPVTEDLYDYRMKDHYRCKDHDVSNVKNDLALIYIEDPKIQKLLAPLGTMKVSKKPIRRGEEVTMVGYGDNRGEHIMDKENDKIVLTTSGAGPKREGFNKVQEIDHHGLISIRGKSDTETFLGFEWPDGENASILHGDSGGPLLNSKGEIVGVASAGSNIRNHLDTELESSFVQLALAENKTFINLPPKK